MKRLLFIVSFSLVLICPILQSIVLRNLDYTSSTIIFKFFGTTKELGTGSKIVDGLVWIVCYVVDPLTYGTVHVMIAPIYDLAMFFRKQALSDGVFDAFIQSGHLSVAILYWLACIYLLWIDGERI